MLQGHAAPGTLRRARAPTSSRFDGCTLSGGTLGRLHGREIPHTGFRASRTSWTRDDGHDKSGVVRQTPPANLLLMPVRVRDNESVDQRCHVDAPGRRGSLRAANDKDVEAFSALNDQLYQSCVTCHEHYRPG